MKHLRQLAVATFGLCLFISCDLWDENADEVKVDLSSCIDTVSIDSESNTKISNGMTIKNTSNNDILIDYINIEASVECAKDGQKVNSTVVVKKDIAQDAKVLKSGKTLNVDYQKEVLDAADQKKTEGYVCSTVSTGVSRSMGKCPYKQATTTTNSTSPNTTTAPAAQTASGINSPSIPSKPLERSDSLIRNNP
jgi:hypothetical protein